MFEILRLICSVEVTVLTAQLGRLPDLYPLGKKLLRDESSSDSSGSLGSVKERIAIFETLARTKKPNEQLLSPVEIIVTPVTPVPEPTDEDEYDQRIALETSSSATGSRVYDEEDGEQQREQSTVRSIAQKIAQYGDLSEESQKYGTMAQKAQPVTLEDDDRWPIRRKFDEFTEKSTSGTDQKYEQRQTYEGTAIREQSIRDQIAIFEKKAADNVIDTFPPYGRQTSKVQTKTASHMKTSTAKFEQITKKEAYGEEHEVHPGLKTESEDENKERKRLEGAEQLQSEMARAFDTITHVPNVELEGISGKTKEIERRHATMEDIEKYPSPATDIRFNETEYTAGHWHEPSYSGLVLKGNQEDEYETLQRYAEINETPSTDTFFPSSKQDWEKEIQERKAFHYGRISKDDEGPSLGRQQKYVDISQVPEEDILRPTQTQIERELQSKSTDRQLEISQHEDVTSQERRAKAKDPVRVPSLTIVEKHEHGYEMREALSRSGKEKQSSQEQPSSPPAIQQHEKFEWERLTTQLKEAIDEGEVPVDIAEGALPGIVYEYHYEIIEQHIPNAAEDEAVSPHAEKGQGIHQVKEMTLREDRPEDQKLEQGAAYFPEPKHYDYHSKTQETDLSGEHQHSSHEATYPSWQTEQCEERSEKEIKLPTKKDQKAEIELSGETDKDEDIIATIPIEVREGDRRYEVESEGEKEKESSFSDKIFGFAKKAGMVAGGVVAAPMALAATGAVAAYDAISKHRTEGEEAETYSQEGAVYKEEVSSVPSAEQPEHGMRTEGELLGARLEEPRQEEERVFAEVEKGVEREYHYEFREGHVPTEYQKEPVTVVAEREQYMYEAEDLIPHEQLTRDEELVESAAAFPPVKEYVYHYEIREEISPSVEQKEPTEEQELVSPRMPEREMFAGEEPFGAQFEEDREAEKRIAEEGEKGVAPAVEYEYHYESKEEAVPRGEQESVLAAAERKHEAEDVIPHEELTRDEELVESAAAFPPVKEYEYHYEIREEISPSVEQKEPTEEQELVSPRMPEREMFAGEEPFGAQFEEEREAEKRIAEEGEKGVAPAVEYEYHYESKEEAVPRGEQESVLAAAERKHEAEDVIPHEELTRDEELVESAAAFPPVKEYEYHYEIREEISPSVEQKEPTEEQELVSPRMPEREMFAGEEPFGAQFEEEREAEKRIAEEGEKGVAPAVEYEYHYESKEEAVPRGEQESVLAAAERKHEAEDVIPHEELTRDEELVESAAAFPPVKEYEYHYEIREEISPSVEQKEPTEEQELVSPRMPEREMFAGEEPFGAQFEEQREAEKRIAEEGEKGVAAAVEYEYHYESKEEAVPRVEEESVLVAAERKHEAEDVIPHEELTRDEELVESAAAFPPVKEYEYHYEIREEISPSVEQKEPIEEQELVSPRMPECEMFAGEVPFVAQFEEQREAEKRIAEEGEKGVAAAVEYEYHYESKEEAVPRGEEESVLAAAERKHEAEDVIPHEELTRDEELVESAAAFPPVKEYEYHYEFREEISPSVEQKEPIEEQELVSPRMPEREMFAGEEPFSAQFEEEREHFDEGVVKEIEKGAAPVAEYQYEYEMKEEQVPRKVEEEVAMVLAERRTETYEEEDLSAHEKLIKEEEFGEAVGPKPMEVCKGVGRYEVESEGEKEKESSFSDKIFGFAKKAGMVAGGVVAAPVALAATGAVAAYDAISKHRTEGEEAETYSQEGAVYKGEVSAVPSAEQPEHGMRTEGELLGARLEEPRQEEERLFAEVEKGVEREYHYEFREGHVPTEYQKEPVTVVAEREQYMYEAEDLIPHEQLSRDEELVESAAAFPPVKEYEYHYEIREEISPSVEQKEPIEEQELVSPRMPEREMFAGEEPFVAQFEEQREAEKRIAEEGEKGVAAAVEYEYHYESKEEAVPRVEEESVLVAAERKHEAEDVIPHEELTRDEELVESAAAFPPVKEYEYHYEIREEISPSVEQKEPIEEQELVSPRMPEREMFAGEEPFSAQFEEEREHFDEGVVKEIEKGAAPVAEYQYEYEMKEEQVPRKVEEEVAMVLAERRTETYEEEDLSAHEKLIKEEEFGEAVGPKPMEVCEGVGRYEVESEGEKEKESSFSDKIFGFAKKAGMVAGGVVAAPVALAATGAVAAYDAISKHRTEGEEAETYSQEGAVYKGEVSAVPSAEQPEHGMRTEGELLGARLEEPRQEEERLFAEVEKGVEREYHYEFREGHVPTEYQKEPVTVVAEREQYMYEAEDLIPHEQLLRDEELVESAAAFPPVKEYEYHYEIREEISPSVEQKEPIEEQELVSPRMPEREMFAGEEPFGAQSEEEREAEKRIAEEGEKGVAPAVEYECHYESKEEAVPRVEEESVLVAAERKHEAEDVIPHEELTRDEELVESAAAFPPVKEYVYHYEIREEISPSVEQKEPTEEQELVSPRMPEREMFAGEEPFGAQFEEEREAEKRIAEEGEKGVAPAVEYEYHYESKEEAVPRGEQESVLAAAERKHEAEDVIPHEELTRDEELVESAAAFPPVKEYEYHYEIREEISPSVEQKEPTEEQELVSPRMPEREMFAGEEPFGAQFEEEREAEKRIAEEGEKGVAPAVEYEYHYESKEEAVPRGEQESVLAAAERKHEAEDVIPHEELTRDEELVESAAAFPPVKEYEYHYEIREEISPSVEQKEPTEEQELVSPRMPEREMFAGEEPFGAQFEEQREAEKRIAEEGEKGVAAAVEYEYHYESKEEAVPRVEEESVLVAAERKHEAEDVIPHEELTRDEELVESAAAFPPVKEYEYHYEIREEISPSVEQKEPIEEQELVSPRMPECEMFAGEVPFVAQFEEQREAEKRIAEEGEKGVAAAVEYEYHYESKEEAVPRVEEESVLVAAERKHEAEDVIPHEELTRDEELVESAAAFPPVKEYEYHYEIREEISPSVEQKEPIEEQELVSPRMPEREMFAGEEPFSAQFEEEREHFDEGVVKEIEKGAAPVAEYQYEYEMKEEQVPRKVEEEVAMVLAERRTETYEEEDLSAHEKLIKEEEFGEAVGPKPMEVCEGVGRYEVESEGEKEKESSFSDKIFGFAKKAGMVAGGVVAAPVALAATGAVAAYDAISKHRTEGEEAETYSQEGAVYKGEVSAVPSAEQPEHGMRTEGELLGARLEEPRQEEERLFAEVEKGVEREYHYEFREGHVPTEYQKEPVTVVAEREQYMYEAEDLIPHEQLLRDEELVESAAAFPPVKEYEYHYEIREEISPSVEQKEPIEEQELVSPRMPEREMFAGEEPFGAQSEEEREAEKRIAEEGEKGVAPAVEYECHYESKEEAVPRVEEESVLVAAERKHEAEDVIPHEELTRDEELVESAAAFPPVKEYVYHYEIREEISPSVEQKEPTEEQELVSPRMPEREMCAGEEPFGAQFEEEREAEKRIAEEGEKGVAPAVEYEYHYESKEEAVPRGEQESVLAAAERKHEAEDVIPHEELTRDEELVESAAAFPPVKEYEYHYEIREEISPSVEQKEPTEEQELVSPRMPEREMFAGEEPFGAQFEEQREAEKRIAEEGEKGVAAAVEYEYHYESKEEAVPRVEEESVLVAAERKHEAEDVIPHEELTRDEELVESAAAFPPVKEYEYHYEFREEISPSVEQKEPIEEQELVSPRMPEREMFAGEEPFSAQFEEEREHFDEGVVKEIEKGAAPVAEYQYEYEMKEEQVPRKVEEEVAMVLAERRTETYEEEDLSAHEKLIKEEEFGEAVGPKPMEVCEGVGRYEVESEGEKEKESSFSDKIFGFAKKAGMVAGGVVAAPVALAATGAVAAYDAISKHRTEGEEAETYSQEGAVYKGEVSAVPSAEQPEHGMRTEGELLGARLEEPRQEEERLFAEVEKGVEREYHYEFREGHVPTEYQKEPVTVVAEREQYMYEAEDLIPHEQLLRDEELVESAAAFPPVKEYEYHYEIREEISPSVEQKEPIEEQELVSPRMPEREMFAGEEPFGAQSEEEREAEKRIAEEGEKGVAPAVEYECHYESKEEAVPRVEEESVLVAAERKHEAEDVIPHEELTRDEELVESAAAFPPVKEYVYHYEIREEISPSVEQKEPTEEQELVSPRMPEREMCAGEEPFGAQFEEEREAEKRIAEEGEKGVAPAVEYEYHYESKEEAVPRVEEESVLVAAERKHEAEDVIPHEELTRDEELVESAAAFPPVKEYEYHYEFREEISPSVEQKEPIEEQELVSPRMPEREMFAGEEPFSAQFEEEREHFDEGVVKEIEKGAAPVAEYQYEYEMKEEQVPRKVEEEVAMVLAERRTETYEEEDLSAHEKLIKEEEFGEAVGPKPMEVCEGVGRYEVESEGEKEKESSFSDKIFGFAKKAGMVAGGVVAAPVALAATGAVAAYDAISKHRTEGEEAETYSQEGAVYKGEVSAVPSAEQPEHGMRTEGELLGARLEEPRQEEERLFAEVEKGVEREYHYEFREGHVPTEYQKEPVTVVAEREQYMYEAEDLIPHEQLSRDEELVESAAAFPPVKEYEYHYEIREEINPSVEQKEPIEEQELVSPRMPEREMFAGEEPFGAQSEEEREAEKRIAEEGEKGVAPAVEYEYHYESKEEAVPRVEEESVLVAAERKHEAEDVIPHEELTRDEELVESAAAFPPVKEYEYHYEIREEISPSVEQKEPIEEQELVSPRMPEREMFAGEEPFVAQFEEQREAEKRIAEEGEKGVAAAVEYEYHYESKEEAVPRGEEESVLAAAERKHEAEDVIPHEELTRDEELVKSAAAFPPVKEYEYHYEIREEISPSVEQKEPIEEQELVSPRMPEREMFAGEEPFVAQFEEQREAEKRIAEEGEKGVAAAVEYEYHYESKEEAVPRGEEESVLAAAERKHEAEDVIPHEELTRDEELVESAAAFPPVKEYEYHYEIREEISPSVEQKEPIEEQELVSPRMPDREMFAGEEPFVAQFEEQREAEKRIAEEGEKGVAAAVEYEYHYESKEEAVPRGEEESVLAAAERKHEAEDVIPHEELTRDEELVESAAAFPPVKEYEYHYEFREEISPSVEQKEPIEEQELVSPRMPEREMFAGEEPFVAQFEEQREAEKRIAEEGEKGVAPAVEYEYHYESKEGAVPRVEEESVLVAAERKHEAEDVIPHEELTRDEELVESAAAFPPVKEYEYHYEFREEISPSVEQKEPIEEQELVSPRMPEREMFAGEEPFVAQFEEQREAEKRIAEEGEKGVAPAVEYEYHYESKEGAVPRVEEESVLVAAERKHEAEDVIPHEELTRDEELVESAAAFPPVKEYEYHYEIREEISPSVEQKEPIEEQELVSPRMPEREMFAGEEPFGAQFEEEREHFDEGVVEEIEKGAAPVAEYQYEYEMKEEQVPRKVEEEVAMVRAERRTETYEEEDLSAHEKLIKEEEFGEAVGPKPMEVREGVGRYEVESEGEKEKESSFSDKIFGFAKKAGMVAGGVVAAPVALAATGAVAAYDAISKHRTEGEEAETYSQEGAVYKEEVSAVPSAEQPEHGMRTEGELLGARLEEPREEEERVLAEVEKGVEHEYHYEFREGHVPTEYQKEPVTVVAEREQYMYEAEDLIPHEQLTRDEELVESAAAFPPVKEYEYHYDIREEMSPSVEHKESSEVEALIARSPSQCEVFVEEEWQRVLQLKGVHEEVKGVFSMEGDVDANYKCYEVTDVHLSGEGVEMHSQHVEGIEDFMREKDFGEDLQTSVDFIEEVSSSHPTFTSHRIFERGIDEEALSNVDKVGIHHIESPNETTVTESESTRPPAGQSDSERSSGRDETLKIASGDIRLCGTVSEKIFENFSEDLVNDVLEDIERDVTEGGEAGLLRSISSDNQSSFVDEDVGPQPKSSSQGMEHEHEVDYESDLREKLDALANENKSMQLEDFRVTDAIRHDFIEEESDEEELSNEIGINEEVADMIDDVIKNVSEALSHSDSTYKTATSRDGYETCLTSQEDTFESAPGWQSQESEYTTATSGGESCLSEASEERRGSATPIAVLSPVQSDRHFTAAQDQEQELLTIRNFNIYIDSKRSTPEVPEIELAPVEDEEEPDEERLATSASGVLLIPEADPGRPISPIPPRIIEEEDQGIVIVTNADSFARQVQAVPFSIETFKMEPTTIFEEETNVHAAGSFHEESMRESIVSVTETHATDDSSKAHITETQHPLGSKQFTPSDESIHEKAMDVENEYVRQYSDISSESKAETVVDKVADKVETVLPSSDVSSDSAGNVRSDSSDSLDKISLKSGSSGKRYSTSRPSSNGSRKSSHDEPQTFVERLTPELKMTWSEADQRTEIDHSPKQETPLSSPEEEFRGYSPEEEPVRPSEAELETVEEEPEDADSLNGQSVSSNGQTTDSAILGKYKHVSSDNVSETSLQEFERIERDVLNKGESSLSGSELELYAASKLKTSADGSTSSLAEFERLEQEVGEGSPQEEVMMLSDIREESEVEDMSVRDDDEEEPDSISDIKSVPVGEEVQAPTPIASPTDSIERDFEHVIPELLQTSTDSLEPSVVLITDRKDDKEGSEEYEIIERTDDSLRDSLENIPHDRDSLLEGASSQEMASQDTCALLSGDTVSTYQEYQEDERDSLAGDMDTMLGDYPTTLTTFETTQLNEDGSIETISRRVLTRVKDPVISHVQFTGTESEQRLRELARGEEYETVDSEGNVTRTILHRRRPSSFDDEAGHKKL